MLDHTGDYSEDPLNALQNCQQHFLGSLLSNEHSFTTGLLSSKNAHGNTQAPGLFFERSFEKSVPLIHSLYSYG